MHKGIIAGVVAGMAGFVAAAWGQNIMYPPLQPVVNPADVIQIVPGGAPSAQNKYVIPAQITSQMGYQKVSPVTGFTYTFGNSQSMILFTGAVTPLAGTVTFAANPSDGDNACMFSQGGLSTLNLAAGSTGQTIHNAITALTATTKVCYLYDATGGFWDRN